MFVFLDHKLKNLKNVALGEKVIPICILDSLLWFQRGGWSMYVCACMLRVMIGIG